MKYSHILSGTDTESAEMNRNLFECQTTLWKENSVSTQTFNQNKDLHKLPPLELNDMKIKIDSVKYNGMQTEK